MKVVIATRNTGKLAELRALLPGGLELLTLDDVDLDSPDETGTTFEENARIKARHASKAGYVALADDSGLVVDALGGEPGVWSSRYAGDDATDADNNRKLITELSSRRADNRCARFVSAVVAVAPDGTELSAIGEVCGVIVDEPRGSNGFGYDPHFKLADSEATGLNGKTMAELALQEKNNISHRARAYRALLDNIAKSTDGRASAFGALLHDENDGRES